MSLTAWRFQSDITPGDNDPDVTVFLGDTYTNDTTGEKTVYHDTSNPAVVKLSALNSFLVNPTRPEGQKGGTMGVPVKP
jgi:hypothetical protein